MQENNIPTNDLYGAVFPELEKYQREADVHFTDFGSEYLAEVVSEKIKELI
ncbi:MAG: hypothetical protein ACYTFY_04685 [Planctomycetota bacterium]|jgi:hypothetical protein